MYYIYYVIMPLNSIIAVGRDVPAMEVSGIL